MSRIKGLRRFEMQPELYTFAASNRNPFPFLVSLLLHFVLVAALSQAPPSSSVTNIPDEVLVIDPKKVLWYRFEDLPKVAPPKQMARAETPKSSEVSILQSVITDAEAPRAAQHVWVPLPAPEIKQVIPSPDMVKVQLQPDPPKPKPKEFQPPERRKQETPNVELADAPQIEIAGNTVPAPKLPVPPGSNPGELLVSRPLALGERQIVGSVPTVNPGTDGVPGVATSVVLNLTPPSVEPIPEVKISRPSRLSRAQETGPAAAADSSGSLKVPNVAIEGKKNLPASAVAPAPNPDETKPGREVAYDSPQLGGVRNSISVPLRPFSRSVPGYVEKVFAGRNVYTMILPMARMAEYSGDWVVWFGERTEKAGLARVKAPLPRVKWQSDRERMAAGGRDEVRVRARTLIAADGKVKEVSILYCSKPDRSEQAKADLMGWQFQPATRDGEAFDTDALVEFTYRAPLELAH